jgi:hypothetical protein
MKCARDNECTHDDQTRPKLCHTERHDFIIPRRKSETPIALRIREFARRGRTHWFARPPMGTPKVVGASPRAATRLGCLWGRVSRPY